MSTKQDNISTVESCWNKAELNEPVFILLGRDESAQAAIHAWIKARIRSGKNSITDAQIQDAMNSIREMELYRQSRKS